PRIPPPASCPTRRSSDLDLDPASAARSAPRRPGGLVLPPELVQQVHLARRVDTLPEAVVLVDRELAHAGQLHEQRLLEALVVARSEEHTSELQPPYDLVW